MLWVTWRQHRGLLIIVAVAFCAAVAGLLETGLRIHQDYALLIACHPATSAACQGLSNFFNSTDWREGQFIHVAVQAAPVLVAMFAGPPVVARELETRTFRFAWTQGIGRVRWTAAKLALLGAALVIPAFAISQLLTWLYAPFLSTQGLTALTPTVFDTSGLSYAAWTLVAFCLGAFLGALVRRTLPAMAAALGVYVGLAGLTWFYLRNHYPVKTYWPMQLFEAGWLLILSAAFIAGTLWLVRRYAALPAPADLPATPSTCLRTRRLRRRPGPEPVGYAIHADRHRRGSACETACCRRAVAGSRRFPRVSGCRFCGGRGG
jgi:hypothetical protein